MSDPAKSRTLVKYCQKSIPNKRKRFASFIVLSIHTFTEIQANFEQVLVSKSW